MTNEKQAEWAEKVKDFHSSGQSQRERCRLNGEKRGTLRYWLEADLISFIVPTIFQPFSSNKAVHYSCCTGSKQSSLPLACLAVDTLSSRRALGFVFSLIDNFRFLLIGIPLVYCLK